MKTRHPYKYEITFMSEGRSSAKGDEVEKREKYRTKKAAEARFRNLERTGLKPSMRAL